MPSARAGALRCSICALDFPTEPIFTKCPECGEATTRFSNSIPMPKDEALAMLLHAAFERFYANYDAVADPLDTRMPMNEAVRGIDLEPA